MPGSEIRFYQVAIDGLSVVTHKGGAGDECFELLGGFTLDQLRWIFSSYTEEELIATGWDATSIANSDGDETTHLWSELSADCPETEIMIAGPDSESGTYEYFSETIFPDIDNGETFDDVRPDGYFSSASDEEIITYLDENNDAIAYFGFAYYSDNQDKISAAAIENADGEFVMPSSETVADGSYNPLARRIYMNLWNDEAALAVTVPFVQFGLGPQGAVLVSQTGYVPIASPDLDIAVSKTNSA